MILVGSDLLEAKQTTQTHTHTREILSSVMNLKPYYFLLWPGIKENSVDRLSAPPSRQRGKGVAVDLCDYLVFWGHFMGTAYETCYSRIVAREI